MIIYYYSIIACKIQVEIGKLEWITQENPKGIRQNATEKQLGNNVQKMNGDFVGNIQTFE